MCPVAFRFFGPERWGTVPRLMWLRIVFGWHARLKRDAIDEIVLRHLIAGATTILPAASRTRRSAQPSRINRLAARGAVLFFYHVVLTVTASSWEYFVRLQISSQRTSCQRGSCEH
jgi:hypothetical protein